MPEEKSEWEQKQTQEETLKPKPKRKQKRKHKRKLLLLIPTILLLAVVIGVSFFAVKDHQRQEEIKTMLESTDPNLYANDPPLAEAVLPFRITSQPIDRLALINFEQDPDTYYNAMELQRVTRGGNTAYQVLMTRLDGYVELYYDASLGPIDPVTLGVQGKGLDGQFAVSLAANGIQPDLSVDDQSNVHIVFSFTDRHDRLIDVQVHEGIGKQSTPLNLLAPIGVSSEKPTYFPLFWLPGFDFVRTRNLDLAISIDGRAITPEPFPVPLPMAGQKRNFIRYTMTSDIRELFPVEADVDADAEAEAEAEADAVETQLETVPLTQNRYVEGDVTYQFTGEGALAYIHFADTVVTFEPPLALAKASPTTTEEGLMTIASPTMGTIKSTWQIAAGGAVADAEEGAVADAEEGAVAGAEGGAATSKDDAEGGKVVFTLDMGAWEPVVKLFMHRIIVNENSVFCLWSADYVYTLELDPVSGLASSRWENRG